MPCRHGQHLRGLSARRGGTGLRVELRLSADGAFAIQTMPLRQRGELHAFERVRHCGVVASTPRRLGAETARVVVPAGAPGGRRNPGVQLVDREPVAKLEVAVLDGDAVSVSRDGLGGSSAAETRAEGKQRADDRG